MPWVSVNVKPFAHSPRVESHFPSVLWIFCTQVPLVFKSKCSGVSSSQCQTLRLGSLTWVSELSLLWENLCNIIIFQFVGRPPAGMGFDYIMKVPLLRSHCGFLFAFGCRISFLVCSILFVNGCLAVSCDLGIFMRGDVLKFFYSTILSPSKFNAGIFQRLNLMRFIQCQQKTEDG